MGNIAEIVKKGLRNFSFAKRKEMEKGAEIAKKEMGCYRAMENEHKKLLGKAQKNIKRMIHKSKIFKKAVKKLFADEEEILLYKKDVGYYHRSYGNNGGTFIVKVYVYLFLKENINFNITKDRTSEFSSKPYGKIFYGEIDGEAKKEIRKIITDLSKPEETIKFFIKQKLISL